MVRYEDRVPICVQPVRRGAEAFLKTCGWCQRVQDSFGEWSEIERHVAILERIGPGQGVLITHGICDRCLHDLLWQSPRPRRARPGEEGGQYWPRMRAVGLGRADHPGVRKRFARGHQVAAMHRRRIR